VIPW